MSRSTFEEEIARSGFLCYSIKGVSMRPLLRQQRDIVTLVKPSGRLKKYDVALYKKPGGKYILHRIVKVRDKDYVFLGDNCVRSEYGITDDDIIGVMDSFVRKGKKHAVTSRGYRIYSHIITDAYPVKAAVLWVRNIISRIIRKARKIFK